MTRRAAGVLALLGALAYLPPLLTARAWWPPTPSSTSTSTPVASCGRRRHCGIRAPSAAGSPTRPSATCGPSVRGTGRWSTSGCPTGWRSACGSAPLSSPRPRACSCSAGCSACRFPAPPPPALYGLSPYLLDYVNRTSVLLAPWAALGWLLVCTVLAARRGGWRWPAVFALVVATVGGINATALVLAGVAPVLWLAHAAWVSHEVPVAPGARHRAPSIGVLTLAASAWWLVALAVAGRATAPTSSPTARRSTRSPPPRSPPRSCAASATGSSTAATSSAGGTARRRRTSRTPGSSRWGSASPPRRCSPSWPSAGETAAVAGRRSSLAGIVVSRRCPSLRRPSPLGRSSGSAALDPRPRPAVAPPAPCPSSCWPWPSAPAPPWPPPGAAAGARWWRRSRSWHWPPPTCPRSGTATYVDALLRRPSRHPRLLARRGRRPRRAGRRHARPGAARRRVRGVPVGHHHRPDPARPHRPPDPHPRPVARSAAPAPMDLLYALDDRFQEGVGEPAAIAPIARLLGAGAIVYRGDTAFERYRTARPEPTWAVYPARAPGLGPAADRTGRRRRTDPPVADVDEVRCPILPSASPCRRRPSCPSRTPCRSCGPTTPAM